jgi:hypothetical protein
MNIRRFNSAGLEHFGRFLNDLRQTPSLGVPREWLEDDTLTDRLGTDIAVEDRHFPRRFEAAAYLYERIHGRVHEPERDAGLWAWLTLFYFDQVCPLERDGRKTKQQARLFPFVGEWNRYYRHLLLGPYVLYAAHADEPERALCVLANPVNKPGEVVEQFAARKLTATSAAVLRVGTMLYTANGAYKRGVQSGGSSSDIAGAPRRLSRWWLQIDRTYDLSSTDGDSMLAILPREYLRFREAEPPLEDLEAEPPLGSTDRSRRRGRRKRRRA